MDVDGTMRRGASDFTEKLRGLRAALQRLRSISFAQYSEDTILYSFLPQLRGFYIDVGAFHPSEGSNTYKLYLRGWSGITIEPNPETVKLFRHFRSRDLHLNMGVAKNESRMSYYEFDDPKLNSFDPQQASRMDMRAKRTTEIKCMPLRQVVKVYCPDKKIDLLSIDCEGLDYDALESLGLDEVRPRVVVIEDFEQFWLAKEGQFSRIRNFMKSHRYALCSQAIFSYVYVDETALGSIDETGFCIGRSQLGTGTDKHVAKSGAD